MDLMEDLTLVHQTENFKLEFRIENFTTSWFYERQFIPTDTSDRSIAITILRENMDESDYKEYVMFSIEVTDRNPHIGYLSSCFIANILDVNGEKKLPRTFKFFLPIEERSVYQEYQEYVERRFILSNRSEFLREDTLIIIVEGTLEQWLGSALRISVPTLQECISSFEVFESPDLKVYLRKNSVIGNKLRQHSGFFRGMWSTPMRESQEEFLLENDDLSVFINILAFLSTGNMKCFVSAFELYKMAHVYLISTALEECRRIIEKEYLCDSVLPQLNFITQYDMKYSYHENTSNSQDMQAWNLNFETEDDLDSPEIVDARIFKNTTGEFDGFLNSLRHKMENGGISSSVLEYWTPEKNACNFKTAIWGRELKVYLRKDSEHTKFLMEYSSVFRELANSPSTEIFIPLENVDVGLFLHMLCFLEAKKPIFDYEWTEGMYRIAYQYDVPILHALCRKILIKEIRHKVSKILNFAKFYGDKELEKTVESYRERLQEIGCPDLKVDNEVEFDHTLSTHSLERQLISSKEEFLSYIDELWSSYNRTPTSTSDSVSSISTFETESELFDSYIK